MFYENVISFKSYGKSNMYEVVLSIEKNKVGVYFLWQVYRDFLLMRMLWQSDSD